MSTNADRARRWFRDVWTAKGMTWLEFKDGQIVRGWDSWNLGELLKSLGAPGYS